MAKTITVIGAGYVGLVTAACFADLGHRVNLVDIDAERVSALRSGTLPVSEPGLEDLWERNRREGRLHITGEYAEGLYGSEFAFIAVGTPSAGDGRPDLQWVRLAANNIIGSAAGPMVVVMKSTVPVGTADMIKKLFSRSNLNGHFSIVSNPEFLREGAAVFDFMHPTRVVAGSSDVSAAQMVAALYAPLGSPTIICDNRTAEMSKYASNAFLATRISFINEIARLCDEYAVNVSQVSRIMGLDPRFGSGYLNAGLGWGGSCLPKDIRGLIHMGHSSGVAVPLLRAVLQINEQQPGLAVKKMRRLLGSLNGKTVGILGLSFKPNSDDMREASSLAVISLLQKHGSKIKAYDPLAMKAAAKLMPGIICCTDPYQVAESSDALMLVTEWEEFRKLDFKRIASLMRQPILIDGRNVLDPHEMARNDIICEGIGCRAPRLARSQELVPAGVAGVPA